MFDIKEYYSGKREGKPSSTLFEEEIKDDIDGIISSPFPLYTKSFFRDKELRVDILFPSLDFPDGRAKKYMKSPDYYRFLLSLYPDRETLRKIEYILVRPRHVELNGIELCGLYYPEKKAVALYLHCPFWIAMSKDKIEGSDFLSYDLDILSNNSALGTNAPVSSEIKAPSEIYVLNSLKKTEGNAVEKFLNRLNTGTEKQVLYDLEDISIFYSRGGY